MQPDFPVQKDPLYWLYPQVEAYRTGTLPVSAVHTLFFEESGNPHGKPVVFLHGGPGSHSKPAIRRFFDPRKYRIILFDQRGCGKSTPHASLEDNTTWHSVDDIEKLRKHLQIEKWQVFGGSWGSTLALAYAQKHPQAVTELVLRGIFLLRKKDVAWLYQKGADAVFPDAWEEYVKTIPLEERGDMVAAYHKRITSSDKKVQMEAARTWSIWEGATSKLLPDANFISGYGDDVFAIAFARIECHYFLNGGFFDSDNYLLENVEKLRHIPCTIVHGRYDLVCPMEQAWALHRAWPEADLVICPDSGHSPTEPGISRGLVAATDKYADRWPL